MVIHVKSELKESHFQWNIGPEEKEKESSKSKEKLKTSSFFDDEISKKWEFANEKNVLNYDMNNVSNDFKVLKGKYKIIVQVSLYFVIIISGINLYLYFQLNESREQKRRKREPFDHVNQEFDHSKFNFNKIKPEEVLFSFEVFSEKVKSISLFAILKYDKKFQSNRKREQM